MTILPLDMPFPGYPFIIRGYIIYLVVKDAIESRRKEFFLVGWFEKGEVVWKDEPCQEKENPIQM